MSRRTSRRRRHSARLLARRRSRVRPAAEDVASATCIDQGTPPPPLACATWASSCFASVFSPLFRSFTFPACHFVAKLCTRFVYEAPDATIGDVPECGFEKIFRNVEKCASGVSSLECVDAVVEGTLRMSFENSASACVFVVSHLTSCHA